jgi:hypothetical protein
VSDSAALKAAFAPLLTQEVAELRGMMGLPPPQDMGGLMADMVLFAEDDEFAAMMAALPEHSTDMTSEEVAAREAAKRNGGAALMDEPEPDAIPISRIAMLPEVELADTIEGLSTLTASALADSIFATPDPREAATIRGHAVECTVLSTREWEWVQKHCYTQRPAGLHKRAKWEPKPIMTALVPAVLVFGLRVPGTDVAVFKMAQAKQVYALPEAMGIFTRIMRLSGLTDDAVEELEGN